MILLTTPWDPGSEDPSASYTHANVANVSYNVARKTVNLTVVYGTAPSGVFTVTSPSPSLPGSLSSPISHLAALRPPSAR